MKQFYSPKDGYFDDCYHKDHQGDLPSRLLLKGRKTKKNMRIFQVINDIYAPRSEEEALPEDWDVLGQVYEEEAFELAPD